MTETAKADLERELGVSVPAVELLSGDECAALLAMFQKARSDEKVALHKAIDDALGQLPWVMRGPAKKIMFGKRAG
jgi:hypothetical protein